MSVWEKINGRILNQGDVLLDISLPAVREDFPAEEDGRVPLKVGSGDIIIVSQSCDLEQRKVPFVVVAQISSLKEFEEANPDYKAKGKWKPIAQGRIEALHMLHGFREEFARECLIVDFRFISSLPFEYVERFAERSGERWRLQSPYLEGLSQAFGRFFMRVALPKNLPRDFDVTAI